MAAVQDGEAQLPERVRPDDATIAFAMAVVSSKPPELSVREYILILRQHVSKGRRENALSSAYRHLDTSSYWRTECERLKESLLNAEARTTDAQRQAELSKAKLEILKAATNTGGAKKKRANPDIIPYPRSPKKARWETSPSKETPTRQRLEDDALFEDLGHPGQQLMRALFRINACLKPGERLEALPLSHLMLNASEEVIKVVNGAVDQQIGSQELELDVFATTTRACMRVVSAMLLGFTRLCRADDAAKVRGRVTYALVQMFEPLVANIRKISSAEMQKARAHGANTAARPSTAAKQDKPKGSRRVNIKDYPLLNSVTSFLAAILQQLDAKREGHSHLFEGFLFVILSRMGSNLHVLNFNRIRPATIDAEIASGLDSDEAHPTAAEADAIQAAKIEAPYMLHLLKAGLAQAPAFLSPNTASKSSSKAKTASKPGSVTKASLALVAKERLQRTLINAVFGKEGLDEESDMFLDCLKKPVAVGSVPFTRVKEAEVGEWFREEVWRLLGWEVLAKELED